MTTLLVLLGTLVDGLVTHGLSPREEDPPVTVDEQQLFVDALVAMAILNDDRLSASEQALIERHSASPRISALLREAYGRAVTAGPVAIIVSSMSQLPTVETRTRLARALIQVAR